MAKKQNSTWQKTPSRDWCEKVDRIDRITGCSGTRTILWLVRELSNAMTATPHLGRIPSTNPFSGPRIWFLFLTLLAAGFYEPFTDLKSEGMAAAYVAPGDTKDASASDLIDFPPGTYTCNIFVTIAYLGEDGFPVAGAITILREDLGFSVTGEGGGGGGQSGVVD